MNDRGPIRVLVESYTDLLVGLPDGVPQNPCMPPKRPVTMMLSKFP